MLELCIIKPYPARLFKIASCMKEYKYSSQKSHITTEHLFKKWGWVLYITDVFSYL